MSQIKLGDYNDLTVVKTVDFGIYLDGGDEGEQSGEDESAHQDEHVHSSLHVRYEDHGCESQSDGDCQKSPEKGQHGHGVEASVVHGRGIGAGSPAPGTSVGAPVVRGSALGTEPVAGTEECSAFGTVCHQFHQSFLLSIVWSLSGPMLTMSTGVFSSFSMNSM